MNKLDQARQQVFYAELTAHLAAARQRAASEREELTRQLGLWGHDLSFTLPNSLPHLPRRVLSLAKIETEAVRRRIDLQIARIELVALARSFGLTQAARFINLLEVGAIGKTIKQKETGEIIRDRGFEVEFQIPLFDFGEVRVRQAESIYMEAANRLMERAVNVRSEARDAYRTYRSAYEIANHYQGEVLPLRKIISDESLLRYNAMLIDVFELLAEAQRRITATRTAIETRRDFWLAATDLDAAVIGGGVSGGRSEAPRPSADPAGGVVGH